MEFEHVLTAIADGLEGAGIRFALIGGLAVHAWGRSRPTRDADFAVDLDRRAGVRALMDSLGYRAIFESDAFSNHEHHDPHWGHVDFMYVTGATAEAIFRAAVLKAVTPGRTLPVASPEHLAMMKAAAMKSFPHRALYEAEDVRLLLSVPGVDRDLVRERQGLLELFDVIDKAR